MFVKRLKLKKLNNTRDLGGIKTSDGRKVKSGKLIRSGKLTDLPESTVDKLKQTGLTTVIDLRIETERAENPDTVIDGVEYHWLPVLCTPTVGITEEKSMRRTMKLESYRIKQEFGSADAYMTETYRSIVFNEQPQKELKKFLRLIIENDGCVLWHCTSGKDRAGICAMLVESLLGVDEHIIYEDYLASRRFLKKKYIANRLGLVILPVSFRFKHILFGFMRTKRIYLKSIIEEMKKRYGSVAGYCKTVLEITDEDIEILKAKYTE